MDTLAQANRLEKHVEINLSYGVGLKHLLGICKEQSVDKVHGVNVQPNALTQRNQQKTHRRADPTTLIQIQIYI